MAKKPVEHKDLFNHTLEVGMAVVYSQYNMLTIGHIIKINPKTVRVRKYTSQATRWQQESQQYPQDLIMISSADLTAWMLKGAKAGYQIRAENKDKETT
jgi:hypothetical protein